MEVTDVDCQIRLMKLLKLSTVCYDASPSALYR